LITGSTPPADCGDGGQAAAQAAYPAFLAYFSSLPSTIWGQASTVTSTPTYFCPEGSQPQYDSNGHPTGCVSLTTEQPVSANPTPVLQTTNPYQPSVAQVVQAQIAAGQAAATNPALNPTGPGPSQQPGAPSQPSAPSQPLSTGPATQTVATGTDSFSQALGWLNQTSIGSIPNWGLLVGAFAAIMILPAVLGGRR